MKEDLLQYKLCGYLRQRGISFFHVPNGGYRRPREAAKLKTLGVRAGVADLVLLVKNGVTIFIELKVEKGRLSDSQKEFQRDVTQLGFNFYVIKADSIQSGVEQLGQILEMYDL